MFGVSPEDVKKLKDEINAKEQSQMNGAAKSVRYIYEGDLQRLVERFREMAKCRYELSKKYSETDRRGADTQERIATVYERCARELERTLASETPPEPGQEWREKQ